MLIELNIKNFVIIKHLKIEFSKGLNVITGETGAGKSIIVEALELLLGKKTTNEIIRKDSEKAIIQGLFDISNYSQNLLTEFNKNNIIPEDNMVLITREIHENGKNKCYINNQIVNLSTLKNIGNHLVDFHGKYEHQSLLKKEKQLHFFDGFCKLHEILKEVKDLYSSYEEISKKINLLKEEQHKMNQFHELYKFQLNEIENIDPKYNEDKELENEYKILNNIELLINNSNKIVYNLSESEDSIYSQMIKIKKYIIDLYNIDLKIKPIVDIIETCIVNINEISHFFSNYKDNIEFDLYKFEEIKKRIDKINFLKEKYGNSIDEILKYKDKIKNEIDNFKTNDSLIKELEYKKENIYNNLITKANILSQKRKKLSKNFEKLVVDELKDLGIKHSIFKVDFKEKNISSNGIDDISFLISTNLGEEPKPLEKVVSCGEISRIMLALKKILSETADIPILIFDEIDTGISGKTAIIVGKKISDISRIRQIICITHLPQIALYGNSNYHVEKLIENKHTFTRITKLTKDEKITEIARMIGVDSKQAVTFIKEINKDTLKILL